ncbi:hypothetical protein H7J71_13155 [Mycolicibacterium peregrinum]|uniref:Uncharacterized protein n=1 Tax=Mycolicibacterium peregrinum TaxID=43304 RepID=A0A1X2ARM8_MYCPR|nr:hypothetical protein [Mycolicibacterium peregrinum]MCV7202952.1 hypothetical protein [Mycolicibacterium peregrinum]ORW54044.1 hypothetical protein AWC21_27035 [Mycolicibacterium peregrinum]TGB41476.1 hypothetical protein EJD98_16315 [Mycolicibacterium peregrinum]TGB41800.1 hypothetical protein EJD94_15515 [Mycolicibacterium peregrinum]
MAGVRIFVADAEAWTELTDGGSPTARISAPDLAQARRIRSGLKSEDDDVSVILDVTVAVAREFGAAYRSARGWLELAGPEAQVRYIGTVDGLAGLIADIEAAEVADGVTLIPAGPDQDPRVLGEDVLRRLDLRSQARAS